MIHKMILIICVSFLEIGCSGGDFAGAGNTGKITQYASDKGGGSQADGGADSNGSDGSELNKELGGSDASDGADGGDDDASDGNGLGTSESESIGCKYFSEKGASRKGAEVKFPMPQVTDERLGKFPVDVAKVPHPAAVAFASGGPLTNIAEWTIGNKGQWIGDVLAKSDRGDGYVYAVIFSDPIGSTHSVSVRLRPRR